MGSGGRGGGKRRGVCEAEEVQCVERESGVVCRCVLFFVCGLRCNNMTMTTIPTGQEYRSKPRKSSLRLRTRRKECTASHANTAISNRLLAHAKCSVGAHTYKFTSERTVQVAPSLSLLSRHRNNRRHDRHRHSGRRLLFALLLLPILLLLVILLAALTLCSLWLLRRVPKVSVPRASMAKRRAMDNSRIQ